MPLDLHISKTLEDLLNEHGENISAHGGPYAPEGHQHDFSTNLSEIQEKVNSADSTTHNVSGDYDGHVPDDSSSGNAHPMYITKEELSKMLSGGGDHTEYIEISECPHSHNSDTPSKTTREVSWNYNLVYDDGVDEHYYSSDTSYVEDFFDFVNVVKDRLGLYMSRIDAIRSRLSGLEDGMYQYGIQIQEAKEEENDLVMQIDSAIQDLNMYHNSLNSIEEDLSAIESALTSNNNY